MASRAAPSNQFWDTSAFVALVYHETHTHKAMAALEAGRLLMAWDWLKVEATAAILRRGPVPGWEERCSELWSSMLFLSLTPEDQSPLLKSLAKHKLRAADAGHLYILAKALKMQPGLSFVCFDQELVRAAQTEKIPVWTGTRGEGHGKGKRDPEDE